jgi:hypothetical protein
MRSAGAVEAPRADLTVTMEWDMVKANISPNSLLPLVPALKQLAQLVCTIDMTTIHDGRWHRQIVIQIAEEALKRTDLDENERQQIANDLEKFRADFTKIIESKEVCEKKLVLQAIETALCFGYAAGASPAKLKALWAENARQRKADKNADDNKQKRDIFKTELDKEPGNKITKNHLTRTNEQLIKAACY